MSADQMSADQIKILDFSVKAVYDDIIDGEER